VTPRSQVLTVAAILVVAGVVDFVQRIHVPRSAATRDANIETRIVADAPLPLASARERLQSWFPVQQQRSQDSQNDSEQQGEYAGMPDRADIGGWRFVLRGVFDAGPPFAVLDVQASAGGTIEQHRLSAGDTIKGVTVERIAGRRVSLSDGENEIELALFIDPGDEIAAAKEQR